jgi:2-haloacid dehalogenase
MDLAGYKALSFDCYGTLIDWEAGIAAVLVPWADEVGLDLDTERLLAAYAGNEAAVERDHPTAPYPEVLATAFRRHDRPGWGTTPEPSEAWSYDLELRPLAELAAADAAFAGRAGPPGPGGPA